MWKLVGGIIPNLHSFRSILTGVQPHVQPLNGHVGGILWRVKCAGFQIECSMSEPWAEHCVVFMGKRLYPHSTSLHPSV